MHGVFALLFHASAALLRHDVCSIMQFGSGVEASADVVAADCQVIRMHHVACAAYDLRTP